MEKTMLLLTILLVNNKVLKLKILILTLTTPRKKTTLTSLKIVIQSKIMKMTSRKLKNMKTQTWPHIKISILLFTESKNPIHIFKGFLIQTGKIIVVPFKDYGFSRSLSVVLFLPLAALLNLMTNPIFLTDKIKIANLHFLLRIGIKFWNRKKTLRTCQSKLFLL